MTDRLTRAELARENEAAHDALDALGVDRGDERGAWPLAERIRRLADARPVVDAAIAFVHQPGGRHYIPESLSPVCKLEDAVRTYEEVKP